MNQVSITRLKKPLSALLLLGLPFSTQSLQLTDSTELILNGSWFQYDYEISSPNRAEQIPVSGTQTTIGITWTDWSFSWSPLSASGDLRFEVDNGMALADYQSDADTLSVTRYFSPWYVRTSYTQSDSNLDIRLSDGRPFNDKQQESTDLSLEAGKSWTIGNWDTGAYGGIIRSAVSTEQQLAMDNAVVQQQEDVTEHYVATGVSASYYWETIHLIPGIGLDYQRQISSDGNNQTELLGQRGRPIGQTSGSSQSSGLVNWSAVYATLDYEFSHLGISLYYQYELNEPNQDYSNIAFYLLF